MNGLHPCTYKFAPKLFEKKPWRLTLLAFLLAYLYFRYPPELPANATYFKTLIAGFPSGDKRLTFVQMEALTGLSARDEWDFAFLGQTNQPFIKANYVSERDSNLNGMVCDDKF